MSALTDSTPFAAPTLDPLADVVGHIHSVETCGTVDGPGVRYVLFTSGCPLRCQYCHNPEAQGKPFGDRRSASEVVTDVLRYRRFIRNGGLTISGGEPLMQAEFVHSVFRQAKEAGIHTALDTSGFLGDKASDALLENVDLVILDLKSWNPRTYKFVTGVNPEPTFAFARRLDALSKPVWIRFVLVPGLTDAPDNIDGLASYIATLGNVERIEILPFHKMGEPKYKRLGMPYRLYQTPTPTQLQIESAREIFARHGLETY